MPVSQVYKDPTKVRAGHAGALKRWSDPANRRLVRLDDLTSDQRGLVLALVDAAKKAATPTKVTAQEVERASAHTTRAA